MLYGIDIYDGQWGINISALKDVDFVILKATQGDWEQDHWRKQVKNIINAGKLLGLYHFPEVDKGAVNEARYFVSCVKEYVGKAILCLDWENNEVTGQRNLDAGPGYAKEFLDEVYRLTGVKPLIYTGYNASNDYDFSAVAKKYKLWGAQYLYKYYNHPQTGFVKNPTLNDGWGAWGKPLIYQYNSTSYLNGYGGNLDQDVFYGTAADWKKLAASNKSNTDEKEEVVNVGRRERMVDLALGVAYDDSHGYSQYRRWPWEGTDFDCSSLMYWSAHEAGYDVPTSGYTGTMLADFTNAGFTAVPYDGNIWDCDPGDILLAHNDGRQHTEMYVGDGNNVGAHIAETGDIDGAPGDQTGNEISVAPNWGWWDWVLIPPESWDGGEPTPTPTPTPSPGADIDFCGEMVGKHDTTGSGDDFGGIYGQSMKYIAIDGVGDYQVHTKGGSWLPCVDHYDTQDEEYGMAGDGSPIDAVRIFDSGVKYQTHNLNGGWNDVMKGTHDTGGSGDDYAGIYGVAQDAIRIWRDSGDQPRYNVSC